MADESLCETSWVFVSLCEIAVFECRVLRPGIGAESPPANASMWDGRQARSGLAAPGGLEAASPTRQKTRGSKLVARS
jgi:hypothetical protein